ncbi:phosphoinositide 3-kinase regulatory subunit 6 [Boleophthalmus pectinirostris]|uniref:phosphoinositide 3-kinase regulatory subunit 6 n=1 Tax=Boleophthalmus pectinirostris TaxID=150288 RepID=UPI00242BF722|nr:phosphoinositide 3-kinase regulatory subunit 6 [Boleophthalmus pectinirostris]XP_020794200.2 phosphoinositide 3-kinase regulatory subunit 6 [Boleophthalmus pectinirostris]
MEPTGACSPTVPEPELYRRIQAILPKETDSSQSQDCYNKGMLRWTLHKKVQNNPVNSLSLLWVLIKELEKAERWNSRKNIIPLLHTLMYALIQTAYIPDELYKRVYDFCKRLLTYPQPYCTIGLSCTRQIKKERAIPGLTYQRMVIAEQRLKNNLYPFQERVFVLADPVVFSTSLTKVVSDDIEASVSSACSKGCTSPLEHMCSVVQHSIQANVGLEHSDGARLARALKDKGHDVEHYFQEVLAAFEQCAEESETLKSRLLQLYHQIVADTEPLSSGALCDYSLPNPDMSFYLWTEELDIWRELSKWFRSSSTSDSFSVSQDQDQDQYQDQEDFDLGDSPLELPSDMTRFSVMSNDSGIERDLPLSADLCIGGAALSAACEQGKSDQDSGKLSRKGGIKLRPTVKDSVALMQDTLEEHASLVGEGLSGGKGGRRAATLQRRAGSNAMQNPFLKQQRYFTAKIIAMGDDRVLGRLAKTYYNYRKREARRLFLTMKVNLQFYYIPVSTCKSHHSAVKENLHPLKGNACTLGSYLSMVDPWYSCNINNLGSTITKLAKMQQSNSGPTKDPFISDILSYYVRLGHQPVYFNIYFVKIHFTSMMKDSAEDVFLTHLELEFPDFQHISASLKEKQKKNSSEVCGAMVSMNYKKVTLSGRDTDKGLSLRMMSAHICAIPSSEAEDLNCLALVFNETTTKSKSNTAESKIRTNNIKIRSLESRSFTVTLDKDSRRVYKDVQSIEILPCLDPGYCVQKSMRSKFNTGEEKDAGLSKYMSKGLPLPINTFAGIIN